MEILEGPKDDREGESPSSCHVMVDCWPEANDEVATGEVTWHGIKIIFFSLQAPDSELRDHT